MDGSKSGLEVEWRGEVEELDGDVIYVFENVFEGVGCLSSRGMRGRSGGERGKATMTKVET